MQAIYDARRRWRYVTLCGVFLCLIFSGAVISAQKLPDDAPILISQPNSTRALAAIPTRRGLDTSVSVFKPGAQTRITLFLTNMDLMNGEGANAFRADIEDVRHYRYPLSIVSIEPVAGREWVYALTVRLHGAIGDVGDVLVRVTWRGMSSNRVRLSIGHEGGKMQDDDGAYPTPMPDRPSVKQPQTEAVIPPYTGNIVRFMEQATFGPTSALEYRLRRYGIHAWLNEQLNSPNILDYQCTPTSLADCPLTSWPIGVYPNLPLRETIIPTTCTGTCQRDRYTMYLLQNWFYREALYNEDQQLRRRVSWALSQILVVSGRETVQPSRMLPYIKVLDKHAFGNFRNLLYDITLNPAMGNYLDMAITTRTNPNENYAREILQLFSIGLDMLNQDGTPMLDGQGNRIPTYDQSVVNGFTKVFTGWTFCNQGCPNSQQGFVNYRDPMILIPTEHDTGVKQVLNYPGAVSIIPAGQTADQDLNQALDNIFMHPNVGPFIGKLLIQQLVTSNPTPAYVSRVAAAFNDNGRGVRGDMKAVVYAVLLDPEARGNIKTDPDYGHLREPVLFVTNILRPFNPLANNNATPNAECGGLSDGVINGITSTPDQDVYNPPTVFNYYQMDYVIPNTNLAGPEFGIFSTGTALKRPNFVNQMAPPLNTAAGIAINVAQNVPCGTRIDLTRLQSLAASDSTGALLVATLNKEMMHGAMSVAMRDQILTAVQAVSQTDTLKRARTALYLVATSSQFQVQR